MMKKRRIRIGTTVMLLLIASLLIVPGVIYDSVFRTHFENPEWRSFSAEMFEGLSAEECFFYSDQGQRLEGVKYSMPGQEVRGVAVMVHGLGNGHNLYMNLCAYLTQHGYLVFGYDATGNAGSEGEGVGGLPQGPIDLDHALRYVKSQPEYEGLPIVLIGHSWGAYSAGSVLKLHPDVRAAVLMAGFDETFDLFELHGVEYGGKAASLLSPFVRLHERLKFGDYAGLTVIDGVESSGAGIMIIQSTDDTTVPMDIGYDRFHERWADSPRCRFILYEDRGHTYLFHSEASKAYRDEYNDGYAAFVAENGGRYSAELQDEYARLYLDKSRAFELDEALMTEIVGFFDEYCVDGE